MKRAVAAVEGQRAGYDFQYPQPRVYAMKLAARMIATRRIALSVPSTSGLRDETAV